MLLKTRFDQCHTCSGSEAPSTVQQNGWADDGKEEGRGHLARSLGHLHHARDHAIAIEESGSRLQPP